MSSRRKGNKSRQQRGWGSAKGIPVKPKVDKPTRKDATSESSSDYNGRDLHQTTSQADHSPTDTAIPDDITIEVSCLPPGISAGDLEIYFEGQGGSVEVLSALNLGGGKARVQLTGLTVEEINRLKKKNHKIKKQGFVVKVVEPSPPTPVEPDIDSSMMTVSNSTLKVSGLPDTVDEEFLEMYFESPKAGGCKDGVEECSIVSPGVASITFHSPEVAAQVLSRQGHILQGSPLHLEFYTCPTSKLETLAQEEKYECDKLLVRKIPPDVDQEFLQLFLEKALKTEDFSVVIASGSALVTFFREHSSEELSEMIAKIGGSKPLKGVKLEAELCRIASSIRISNISKHYDEEFIQMYFESQKRSGGGEVTSVELLGNGVAVVAFEDPKVVATVLERHHATFGESVVVERDDPLKATMERPVTIPSAPDSIASSAPQVAEPLRIKVDPFIAQVLQKNPKGLEDCVKNLRVQVTIDVSGIIQVSPTKHTRSGWQECKEQIPLYIRSNYVKQEDKVPKEATPEIAAHLAALANEVPLVFKFNKDSTVLTVAGDCNTVAMLQSRVKEISSTYAQTMENMELMPEDYAFLSQLKAPMLATAYQDVAMQFSPKTHTLILQGSVRNVGQLKQSMPEFASHSSVLVPLHPSIVHFLSTDDGQQQLAKFIENQQCRAAMYFPPPPPRSPPTLLFLCDQNQVQPTQAIAEALKQATRVESHQVPASFVSQLPNLEEYGELCQDLEKKQHVQIVTLSSKQEVNIAGFHEGVMYSSECLQEFIKQKCNVVESVDIEKGIWRLFCGPMHVKWAPIALQCEQNGVKIVVPKEDVTSPEIVLKGDRLEVQKVAQEIARIVKSVARSSIPISRPGTCKYFYESEQAKLITSGIEKHENVCIEIGEISDEGNDELLEVDDPTSARFTKVCVARTTEHKQITIYIGDITEFTRAEVLVNAANGDLQHVGGVAKAISDKGGPEIQQESAQHIKKQGKLDDGDVWLTTKVGTLPYKALIHAVGPRWEGGSKKKSALLHKACLQSLRKAKKYRSIAIPAIGSGVYGFPLPSCAEALIEAAVEFSKNNPVADLQEINFVLFRQSDANAFVSTIKSLLPVNNILESTPDEPQTAPVPQPYFTAPGVAETSSGRGRKKKPAATTAIPDCIKVHRGDLLHVKADVYVNTTNCNLDLSQGAVATALAKAAGPTLQAECKRKAPVSVGNYAVTGAGKLPCRNVLHVVAPNYDGPGGQAEKVMRKLVYKCLKECTKLGVTSIAFPALGAGNLHFPPDVVARIMVGEVGNFMSTHKNTPLTAVHFVIFMADTHQAFLRELAGSKPHSITPTPPQPAATRPRKNGSAKSPPTSGASRGGQTFSVGNIVIQVIHGDITDDNSHAVVNTTNAVLQLAGPGVSGALLRKGGKELQEQCDALISQEGQLEEGKVMHTKATGKLKCKSVFHTMFESQDPKKFMKTITACLHKAEELRYQSIAFPAIGTGAHGYPPEDAARAMLRAIQLFASSKPTHLQCVRMVLFQQHVYQAFIIALEAPAEASQPGLLQRAKDWVGSLLPTWSSSTPEYAIKRSTDEEMMYTELEVKIYGESMHSVQKAEKTLWKVIEDQFISDKVDDPNIDKLPQSEITKLGDLSRQMHVEIDINPAPLNYIRLKGDKADVGQMKYHIIQSLSDFEKRVSRQREIEQLQHVVKWKRQDSQGTWVEYDPEENYEIEQSYQSQQATYTCHTQEDHYTIDFKSSPMQERDASNHTTSVLRIDLREGEKPHHWDQMPVNPTTNREEPVYVVDLTPGSKEYNNVLREFNKTMQQIPQPAPQPVPGQPGLVPMAMPAQMAVQTPNYNSIVKIQRIQNPMQYAQYIARKKEMDKQNPQGHQNEWLLFHGTYADTCPKVNLQSFNRSFAGRNATMYGRGVYFARDASYSARDGYSPRDQFGHKYMYFARVLAGEFTVGNSSMIVPPAKNPQNPNILFDSVVDNTANPQIFVVFHDSHAYPEYLITFN